jgi:hypothetical protein
MSKTIITCAITGNLTKPEMTPYLPITPEQIANSALEAAEENNLQKLKDSIFNNLQFYKNLSIDGTAYYQNNHSNAAVNKVFENITNESC